MATVLPDLSPKHTRRPPGNPTAHFAAGGEVLAQHVTWVQQQRSLVSAIVESDHCEGEYDSISELRRIYMEARIVQGGVVAGRVALPALIDASEWLCGASLPEDFRLTERAATQTDRFLTGLKDGSPREGNDYPPVVKRYIAYLADTLERSFGRTYDDLVEHRPDLVALAVDADEVQRLSWGHLRRLVERAVPTSEIAHLRAEPLRGGTDELLGLVRDRTGVRLPARVMQRDNWEIALTKPRQTPQFALFNAMKFFVENAEVGLLYCLGSLLTRMTLGLSPADARRAHLTYGAHEIAAGTKSVTHHARFQSRIGARPNDYRSFAEFLRNVRVQAAHASLGRGGAIVWSPSSLGRERGWCPAQNDYTPGDNGDLKGFAKRGRATAASLKAYARERFGVNLVLAGSTPAELFGAIVVFATAHEESPLLDDPALHEEWIAC